MTSGETGDVSTEIRALVQSLRDSLCGVATREHARQLQLFPFDPLATAQPVVVLSQPSAGISRAALAPVLTSVPQTDNARITFLLVADDGLTVGFGQTNLAQLPNPETLWPRLLAAAHAGRDACGQPSGEATDCLADWLAPARWQIVCEGDVYQRQAVAAIARLNEHRIAPAENGPVLLDVYDIEEIACEVLTRRLHEALEWVLSSLHADARALLAYRPQLSLGALNELIRLARAHGGEAERNAWQFLRTEPLALVNAVASGEPQAIALPVRQALMSGGSIRQALKTAGVSSAIHRRWLRPAAPALLEDGTPDLSPSELRVSGAQWLAIQSLLAGWPLKNWPSNGADWREFAAVSAQCSAEPLLAEALHWCWVPGQQSSERLRRLTARASSLVRLSHKFAGHMPTLQAALRLAMDLLPNAKEMNDAQFAEAMRRVNTGETAWATATLTGVDVGAAADALLVTLPLRLPDPNIGGIRFKLLRSLAAITDHGMRMGNCLAQPRHAMGYCGVPLVLFEVSARDGPIATLALGFDQPRAGHGPRLVIVELKGPRNGKAPYTAVRAAEHFQATLAYFNLDDWSLYLLAHAAWHAGYQ